MPHRSAHHNYSDHPSSLAKTRPRPAAPVAAWRRAEGFTFIHAGRQIRLGPIAFWVVVGTLVIMAVWSITTATYFAFREDVLTQLVSREADMQFSYEDRIAELRAQIDRLSGRQLLDQEQYEQRLDQLQRRQTTLESRAAALGALPDPISTGSIKSPARSPGSPQRAAPKLSPTGDATPFLPPATSSGGFSLASVPNDGVEGALYRVQASLDRIDARQRTQLNGIEEAYRVRAQRMRGVLADLGINPAR